MTSGTTTAPGSRANLRWAKGLSLNAPLSEHAVALWGVQNSGQGWLSERRKPAPLNILRHHAQLNRWEVCQAPRTDAGCSLLSLQSQAAAYATIGVGMKTQHGLPFPPANVALQIVKPHTVTVTSLGKVAAHSRWNDARFVSLCCLDLRHLHVSLQVTLSLLPRSSSLCVKLLQIVLCSS